MPGDIVGTRVWRPRAESFDTELGPVFANLVLADEINRAPAKVQSALLEAMYERQVSIGGRTYPLPRPFLVMATQNPIESEGVYQPPEAQRDRFLLKVDVPHPNDAEELTILHRMSAAPPRADRAHPRGRRGAPAGVRRRVRPSRGGPVRGGASSWRRVNRTGSASATSTASSSSAPARGRLSASSPRGAAPPFWGRDDVLPGDVADVAT